jgi:hypothetical protein
MLTLAMAMLQLRRTLAAYSPLRPEFILRAVHVQFMMNKVALVMILL